MASGDPDPFNDTALLLTPAWLIWACSGPKGGGVVSSTRLRNNQVTAFHSKLIADSGLDVQTALAGSPEPVVAFRPLSPETAPGITERCRAAAAKAMAGN